jgi:hypothetical protein
MTSVSSLGNQGSPIVTGQRVVHLLGWHVLELDPQRSSSTTNKMRVSSEYNKWRSRNKTLAFTHDPFGNGMKR